MGLKLLWCCLWFRKKLYGVVISTCDDVWDLRPNYAVWIERDEHVWLLVHLSCVVHVGLDPDLGHDVAWWWWRSALDRLGTMEQHTAAPSSG